MEGYPVIVVGTGRSGTSHIARLCQSLGIHMGDRFREPDETNPEGFVEDFDIRNLLQLKLDGHLTSEGLIDALKEIGATRNERGVPWGFKNPRVADCVPEVKAAFPDSRWIRISRPMREVVASMCRCYGGGQVQAERVYAERTLALEACDMLCFSLLWNDLIWCKARQLIAEWLGLPWTPRVLATTCNMGWVHRSLMPTVSHLEVAPNIVVTWNWPESGDYCMKMNQMAKAAVRGGYDYWFNMDDDQGPVSDPSPLFELDLPVIGLPAPIWKHHQDWPFTYSAFDKVGNNKYRMHDPREGGLQEVDAIGSGCMIVRTDVLKAIGLPAFVRVLSSDGCTAIQGPDMYFSDKVVAAGFQLHAHYAHKCNHVKDLELGTMFEKCFEAFELQKDAELVR